MAIVKVFFRKNANNVLKYVFEHTQPGDQADSENAPPYAEGAMAEFEAIRNLHHFKEGHMQAAHIVQSWDDKESKKLTAKDVNAMGRQLVEEHFKGHQFVIVTHTETGKFHNHIVVGSVNMESGKLIENKFSHLHTLRKINDKICLDRGLSIPNQDANSRRANVPHKVQQMVKAGRESWVWDIRNKADLARHVATSHDEYTSYMDALGIKTRTEKENITYFYPGRSRGKRGSKMGRDYDKAGLEKQFKQNDERFQAHPGLRDKIWSDSTAAAKSHSNALGETTKDYSAYTKVSRSAPRSDQTRKSELTRGIIPVEEIKKARRSILDYCAENKIPLTKNAQGEAVLKGKEHIVINGDLARNIRNGTHATLIDFVASHHHLTLLQAVSKINGNSELLLFEQHFGEVKRKFTSFYIPKPDQMPHVKATEHLSKFLSNKGISPDLADPLLKHQRAEVSHKGVIRLFGDGDAEGALEYSQAPNHSWSSTKKGEFKRPFFKRPSGNGRLLLFMEPQSYMAGRKKDLFSDRKTGDGILALMEPSTHHVEQHLKQNPHVKQVDFVTPKGRSLSQSELDFFGVLKKKLEPFGISVSSVSHDKTVDRGKDGLSI